MAKTQEYVNEARDFTTLHRFGVLSSQSVTEAGYPFGSVVPYDITSDGRIIIYISLIAEHYRNLVKDPRGSLTVVDPFGSPNPQAHARVTILLDFSPVPESEADQIQSSYSKRFPDSVNHELAHNFVFYQGRPKKVRWIGGFGSMGWIDGASFSKAAPDPIAYQGMTAINHMNQDHKDSLIKLVAAHSKFDPAQFSILMTGISSIGITIQLVKGEQVEYLEIPFPKILTKFDEVRGAVVGLVRAV